MSKLSICTKPSMGLSRPLAGEVETMSESGSWSSQLVEVGVRIMEASAGEREQLPPLAREAA